jgi:hypothetical protein
MEDSQLGTTSQKPSANCAIFSEDIFYHDRSKLKKMNLAGSSDHFVHHFGSDLGKNRIVDVMGHLVNIDLGGEDFS